jgi:hypothetical protein
MTSPQAARSTRSTSTGRSHLALRLAGASLLLGVLGPFGTYLGMPLPIRLLHFSANVLVIGTLIVLGNMALRRFVFAGEAPLWAALGVALAAALPGAVVVQWHLSLLAPASLAFVTFTELIAQTAVVNLLIGAAGWFLERRMRTGVATRSIGGSHSRPEAPSSPPTPAPVVAQPDNPFDARLPFRLRGAPILSLSAEDHYLRVRTARGEALILCALSEAIGLLDDTAGLRVHRSHWVSWTALALPETRLGRVGLHVADAGDLPVSRRGRRLLAEAGVA